DFEGLVERRRLETVVDGRLRRFELVRQTFGEAADRGFVRSHQGRRCIDRDDIAYGRLLTAEDGPGDRGVVLRTSCAQVVLRRPFDSEVERMEGRMFR